VPAWLGVIPAPTCAARLPGLPRFAGFSTLARARPTKGETTTSTQRRPMTQPNRGRPAADILTFVAPSLRGFVAFAWTPRAAPIGPGITNCDKQYPALYRLLSASIVKNERASATGPRGGREPIARPSHDTTENRPEMPGDSRSVPCSLFPVPRSLRPFDAHGHPAGN